MASLAQVLSAALMKIPQGQEQVAAIIAYGIDDLETFKVSEGGGSPRLFLIGFGPDMLLLLPGHGQKRYRRDVQRTGFWWGHQDQAQSSER